MKQILLFIIALSMCFGIKASECLRVTPKSGDPVTIMFTDRPEISLSGSKLLVSSISNLNGISFELDNIESIDYIMESNGVEDLQTSELFVRYDAAGVHFINIPEGSLVNIFSYAGATIHSHSCSGGEFHLLRSDFAPGVYIVKINKFITKISF